MYDLYFTAITSIIAIQTNTIMAKYFLCKHMRTYTDSRVNLNPSEALFRNKRVGSFLTRKAQRDSEGKMAAAYLTHHQKVLRLYKKSLRHVESWCIFR